MRSRIFLMFMVLISVFSLYAGDGFVGYRQGVVTVKFTTQTLSELDQSLLSLGRTGIAALDRLSEQYQVKKIAAHFRLPAQLAHTPSAQNLKAYYQIFFSQELDEQQVAQAYSALKEVIKAQPVPIHEAYKSSNDSRVADQWHINQSNDADIDAPEGWDTSTGKTSIIVAIMDTGVEWWHLDLAGSSASQSDRNSIRGNMWINMDEISNTDGNVDEDGNGYRDDWVGWDFVTGVTPILNLGDDYDQEDNNPSDKNGHGTHCAGNIGAINNNSRGVCSAGGGWGEDAQGYGNGVKIMALRIGWDDFPSGRVSMDFAANAFIYAADNGAKIASCSWGSSQYDALVDAINYFLYGKTDPSNSDPKIRLIFKAAGNDGDENTDYMTSRDDIISVAATDENDNAASFTTYGTWVDISAPGNNILSTARNGGYESLSGTSMATPIAASVAANLWSYNDQLTASQVEQYLYDGAENIDSHLDAKYIGKMGAGRVSLSGSLALIPPLNHAPVAVDDSAQTPEDTAVVVMVLNNDSDSDNDPISIQNVTTARHGTVSFTATEITYTPQANFFGSDSFQYVIEDDHNAQDTAWVRITVLSRNDPPQIVDLPQELSLEANTCKALYMAQYASDVDTPADQLSWSFAVDDPSAISYQYDETTDSLTICSLGATGDYQLFCTLTDDSGAVDQDTIVLHVSEPLDIDGASLKKPLVYSLAQNFPNPFNPITTIEYTVAHPSYTVIELFTINGQKVATLFKGFRSQGTYRLTVKGRALPSGVYLYRMTSGLFTTTRKMILMK